MTKINRKKNYKDKRRMKMREKQNNVKVEYSYEIVPIEEVENGFVYGEDILMFLRLPIDESIFQQPEKLLISCMKRLLDTYKIVECNGFSIENIGRDKEKEDKVELIFRCSSPVFKNLEDLTSYIFSQNYDYRSLDEVRRSLENERKN